MQFFYIDDDYIEFLRLFDDKVPLNKNESRPFVGVVLRIDSLSYYAPLSSPKKKHLSMKNGLDFRKIASGRLGAINLNNMIPAPENVLTPIVFQSISDVSYAKLLAEQYECIRSDWVSIQKSAQKLRSILISDAPDTPYTHRLRQRCCNLKILEDCYTDYPTD